jgi:dolichyl-diphosphooligosaccharide---protein glycosyltransferase
MASLTSMATSAALLVLILALYALSIYVAYDIRLWAIKVYGRVIHEFDPWCVEGGPRLFVCFLPPPPRPHSHLPPSPLHPPPLPLRRFNFRATQYLADNGIEKFFKWFDHMSWYPLGRPVGTTIYPGMQLVAVYLWDLLKWKGWRAMLGFSLKMSLNDVCVFIPAWFGAIASVCVGFLAREVSGSRLAGALAAVVMAVVPAHLMRSIGGGYDNESVAVTAMSLTFFLWCRSLRTSSSWPIGILAGAAYGFMAAAWGGYIFVGNMVGVHAGWLVLIGHFTPSLHKAYSLWYIVGTLIAVQVPVIGYAPYRSVEQALPLLVFLGMHLLAVVDRVISTRLGISLTDRKDRWRVFRYRVITFASIGAVCLAILVTGMALGLFGGLSVRVKSLFIKHTRTGNPLVDSVAEHQPASTEAYKQYLHHTYALAPLGLFILLLRGASNPVRTDFGVPVNKWFLILYAVVGYYFSARMARLIILLGPVASGLAGVAIDGLATWSLAQLESGFGAVTELLGGAKKADAPAPAAAAAEETKPEPATPTKAGKGGAPATPSTPAAAAAAGPGHVLDLYGVGFLAPGYDTFANLYRNPITRVIRLMIAGLVIYTAPTAGTQFYAYSQDFAKRISQPSLMFQARLNNGQEVMVNDYQEAYWWLRDTTPADARVLSWWDYGYQVS